MPMKVQDQRVLLCIAISCGNMETVQACQSTHRQGFAHGSSRHNRVYVTTTRTGDRKCHNVRVHDWRGSPCTRPIQGTTSQQKKCTEEHPQYGSDFTRGDASSLPLDDLHQWARKCFVLSVDFEHTVYSLASHAVFFQFYHLFLVKATVHALRGGSEQGYSSAQYS